MGSSAWASPVAPASCSNPNCLPKAARKSGRNSHPPRVNIIFALPPWPPRTRHMVSFWDGCSRRNGRRGMTVAPRRELTPEESSSPRSIDDRKSSVRLRVSGDEPPNRHSGRRASCIGRTSRRVEHLPFHRPAALPGCTVRPGKERFATVSFRLQRDACGQIRDPARQPARTLRPCRTPHRHKRLGQQFPIAIRTFRPAWLMKFVVMGQASRSHLATRSATKCLPWSRDTSSTVSRRICSVAARYRT